MLAFFANIYFSPSIVFEVKPKITLAYLSVTCLCEQQMIFRKTAIALVHETCIVLCLFLRCVQMSRRGRFIKWGEGLYVGGGGGCI